MLIIKRQTCTVAVSNVLKSTRYILNFTPGAAQQFPNKTVYEISEFFTLFPFTNPITQYQPQKKSKKYSRELRV